MSLTIPVVAMSRPELYSVTDAEWRQAIEIARGLILAGAPVFIARRALDDSGVWASTAGTGGTGYVLPPGWDRTKPDEAVLDRYRLGDALCMVQDDACTSALDTDPRSGGVESREGLVGAGMWPFVYGEASTPSGGTHELVAPLHVGSRDRLRPGLDVKAARPDGSGRGFIFIAPTVKVSKVTGEVAPYRWTIPPIGEELGPGDDSGAALAEMVTESGRRSTDTVEAEEYHGPPFELLSTDTRTRITKWITAAVTGICSDLTFSRHWGEGMSDQHGRGWEKLQADAAWRLGKLARASWNDLTLDRARSVYLEAAPTGGGWTTADVAGKWDSQHGRGTPAGLPPSLAVTTVPSMTLEEGHAVFTRWFGPDYDLMMLDAVLLAVVVEQLDGDPVWLLVVSGSGAAKTETVQSLDAAGALVTSTITSEGALLSGTSKRERTAASTGGLLRKLGHRGVLVIKDVTSVLSMNRDARTSVLAALREVYDGKWERNLGSDGGQSLTWIGRLVVIGAVTTAWDKAHEVISSMGDRFVLVRYDSKKGRVASGRQAIANTGVEVAMRKELGVAVAGVLVGVDTRRDLDLTEAEAETVLALADIVTLTRTGVEHDYRGDVIDAHAPEMPTRFAKQLTQLMRGGLALGLDREYLLRVVTRCAADSMPPLRLAALADVAVNAASTTNDIRKRMDKPRATVDRTLQALHMLGLLACDEEADNLGRTVWRYELAEDLNEGALQQLVTVHGKAAA